MKTTTKTKAERAKIILAARAASANGMHERARNLFALVGIGYISREEVATFNAKRFN